MLPAPRRLPLLLALPAIAVVIAGCGISNPYQHTSRQKAPSTAAANTSAPATAPTSTTTTGTVPHASSPQAALKSYAQTDINWTAQTLRADQTQIAAESGGSARTAALHAAATYGAGSQLQDSKVTNTGQVTSVAAGQGPLAGQWVITTQEKTGGTGNYSGLPAQAHVYYARLQHIAGGWEVTQWSPQN